MSEHPARDGLVRLRPGELGAADVASMVESIESARQAGAPDVIVDCSAVETATLDGLRALVRWARDTTPRAHGVVLAGARRRLLLAICQTRLQREIDCFGSVEAARAANGS